MSKSLFDDRSIISFDIETASNDAAEPLFALQPWRLKQGKARITSYAAKHNGKLIGALNPTIEDFERMLRHAIKNDIYILGWNVVFDASWLIAAGLRDLVLKAKWLDGMLIMKHALCEPEYENSKPRSYGLKAAVAELFPDEAGYEEDVSFTEINDTLLEYNKKDAELTLKVAQHYFDKLTLRQKKCMHIEAECIPLIADANVRGLHISIAAAQELDKDLETKAAELLTQLEPHGVTEAIIRSPKQLSELIYDKWELPCDTFTDTGARSTDKEALHELSLIDERAKLLKEYREALNNRTKFVGSIIESYAYNDDGYSHPEARIYATYTGRFSYSSNQGRGKGKRQTGFALHQMKRANEYRRILSAPEGYTLVEFDAAAQEFRLMAIAANDPTMLMLCQPGEDPHQYMGDAINPTAEDKKAARQLGKIANLGLGYRTSANKLKSTARVQHGLPMEIEEAETIHATYQNTYKQVPVFWKKQIAKAKKNNFVESFGGRRVLLNDDWKKYEWSMGSTSINFLIQASASDMKGMALKQIKNYIIEKGILYAWDLHDAIYLYVPNDAVDAAIRDIKGMLDSLDYKREWGFDPKAPLFWDCKRGPDWGNMKEIKLEADAEKSKGEDSTKSHSPSSFTHSTQDLEDKGSNVSLDAVDTPLETNIQEVDFTPANIHALNVALDFAAAGIRVFPCKADKSPVSGFTDWERRASFDQDQLTQWFTQTYKHEAAMVGLPPGPNGMVCLDIDRPRPEKKKYADGLELFQNLIAENDIDVDNAPVVVSPTGGQHFFFMQPIDLGAKKFSCSKGALPANIDVKGIGGYVIASGSRRADGIAYQTLPGAPELIEAFVAGEIPQMPQKLSEIILAGASSSSSSSSSSASSSSTSVLEDPSLRIPQHLLAEAFLDHNIANDHHFDDRDSWIKVLHALYAACGGENWGRKIWVAWNANREQKPGEVIRVWDSLKAGNLRMSGVVTIRGLLADRGRTELLHKIDAAPFSKQDGADGDGSSSEEAKKSLFTIDPFEIGDITAIPPRQVIYKHHTRKFLCGTFAPGGVGKSTLTMVEAVAMATGKPLLGVEFKKPLKVYVWNGEDPMDELHRRVAATILHYGLGEEDRALLQENLFLGSGREQQVIIAGIERGSIKIAEPLVGAFEEETLRLGLDVVILDPFVSTHLASEQDNGHMNLVASTWARLAHRTNTSIELVHHVRKTGGEEVTLDDARGAGAITNAMRYTRVLNVMNEKEGDDHGIENRWAYIREGGGSAVGKANQMARDQKATWYKLHGVGLGNATMDDPADNVATLESWEMPQLANEITDDEQDTIIKRLLQDPSEARESPQANEWAGKLVAIELGLDVDDKADVSRIKKLLGKWVKEKKLKVKKIDLPRYGRGVPVYVAGSKRD